MAGRYPLFEIGVMFWAGRDPAETIAELTRLGVHCGQLGLRGDLDLSCAESWKSALESAEFRIHTVFAAFDGERYTEIPTVERTVGFIPEATRVEREARMLAVSDFAAALRVPSIATHIGFVPEDSGDPDYIAVKSVVRRVCDHAAGHAQTFALETGQERADVLLDFIHDVDRSNLGINFDPANLILYGTGDPIEALGMLAKYVLSVHCKDGDWPPADKPEALGKERRLGEGAVGMERFIEELGRIGYRGPLAIEREASDPVRRLLDIEAGINLLKGLSF